jgi:hypothetical protein
MRAVQRYNDGLHVAAEHIIGPQLVEALDHRADQVVPGAAGEPAWPTLRNRDKTATSRARAGIATVHPTMVAPVNDP